MAAHCRLLANRLNSNLLIKYGTVQSYRTFIHRVPANAFLLSNCNTSKLLQNSVRIAISNYGKASSTLTSSGNEQRYQTDKSNWKFLKYGTVAAVIVGAVLVIKSPFASAKSHDVTQHRHTGRSSEVLPNLPTYTADDVAKHDSKDTKIWVSFENGVYDITQFVDKHPGGDKILMSAGGALEPFWMLYAVHQNPQVLAMLEKYRIGNLKEEDRGQATKNMTDPYVDDPRRHPALTPSSAKPFNAEPPLGILVDSFETPSDLFFVRNHLPVPHVDPETYELEVSGVGVRTVTLSLADLKNKFHKHTIYATIQCAGNRRSELTKIKAVKGLNWGAAAISNASWSGAKLRDVLLFAGLKDADVKVKHVHFEGLDTDVTGVAYGASILRDKAMDSLGDVIVAYEMNGQPIPVDHGFPVRLIAPGIVGARNVKWLGRIITSEEESDSHWQQNDYKGFSPNVDWDNVDFKSAPSIQELPIQSAICEPANGATVSPRNGSITVKGYAWSGGGRKVVRVDVSSDGGKTWHTAVLHPDEAPINRAWAWRLWQVNLSIPADTKTDLEIICKATDSSYNVQPENVAPLWNLRGVLNNAWYRVKVHVQPSIKK